jgi:hypothetical protein
MEETKTVFLSEKRKVVLEDDDDIALSLVSNDKEESRFEIAYPSGGYGGGSLHLSPSKKYMIFSYFSGESEEAFFLFKIENQELKFIYDSGYLYGEGADYCFVDDERILVQTFRTGTWYKENAEIDKNGDLYYEFGELNLFYIETHELRRHAIHVYPSGDWEEEKTDIGTFVFDDTNGNEFNVTMPWGKVTFYAPLKNILVVRFNNS